MTTVRRSTLTSGALAGLATLVGVATQACGSSEGASTFVSASSEQTSQPGSPPPDFFFGIDAGADASSASTARPCQHLECQQVACAPGLTTTVSGTVYDPAGNTPLYNVAVYVPNAPLAPLTSGATCDRCGSTASGSPLTATLTDAKGHFSLDNVPAGKDIPLVMQVGKWRRQITIPAVASCAETKLTDRNQTRLPRNQGEGDIPRIALTTGAADTLECLLGKKKIGLDDSEFTTAGGAGRVHLYAGYDAGKDSKAVSTKAFAPTMNGGKALAPAQPLWSNPEELKKYDIVLLSCEGTINPDTKPPAARQALADFTAAGGRVFASHWHRYWFSDGPDAFPTTGSWHDHDAPPDPSTATIDTSFPKGQALSDWLVNAGATSPPGHLVINEPRHNLESVNAKVAQQWITMPNSNAKDVTAIEYMSFNTPLAAPEEKQCGRVVYSDLHVASADSAGPAYPAGCTTSGLTDQEKALEFMLFDLSACIQKDTAPPAPPPSTGQVIY